MQRLVENLERPTGRLEASADDAADAPALLGQALAARQVDARELEQRDALVAGIDVLARSRDQALEQRRAEDGLIAAHRIGQANRSRVGIGGDEAPGVGLAEPGTDEHVLDQPPQPLVAAQVARHRAPQGHRVRHPVEHDPGHLLDQVDFARDVARAQVGTVTSHVVVDLEAESLEDLPLLGGGHLEPDQALGALGTEADDRPRRAARRARPRCRQARRRRDRRSSCSPAPLPARRDTGRRPSPSGSSPPCGGRAAPRSSARRSARSSPPRAAPRSSSRRPRCRRRP